MRTSDLENDIKGLLASSRSRDRFDGVLRQLSCRINVVRHYKIGVLADKVNMTRTSLAERLLEQSIEIAWNAAGFGELSDTDVNAIKALTKASEIQKSDFLIDKVDGERRSTAKNSQSVRAQKGEEMNNVPPNRIECFDVIFQHLGATRGRVKGSIATSRDGAYEVCCLVSKDYFAEKGLTGKEHYWFTIYERQLEDIQQANNAYVAFACGAIHQIALIPAAEFVTWCDELPPYTQGGTGWHVHLDRGAEDWELRRAGRGEPPIDATKFMI